MIRRLDTLGDEWIRVCWLPHSERRMASDDGGERITADDGATAAVAAGGDGVGSAAAAAGPLGTSSRG